MLWDIVLRTNLWKLSSNSRINNSVFILFWSTSISHKFRVLLSPKNVSLEIKKILKPDLIIFQFQIHRVIRLQIDWKISEITQFHNECCWLCFGSAFLHNSVVQANKLGFFDIMTHKTSSGRKTYNWMNVPYTKPRMMSYYSWKLANGFGLHTWLRIKNIGKNHSTLTCHYHVVTPLLIWSKPTFAGLGYPVTLSTTKHVKSIG